MNFSLEWIESFMKERAKLGMKLGFERMNFLLNELNHPEKKIKAIHIAGTNGKGSTIQYLANALMEQGYRIGIFTSPSFIGSRGYILLNNEPIGEQLFITLFKQIYPIICEMDEKNLSPTEFEIMTALAFLAFSESTDLALIETGMGGLNDSTNVINPLLSIITNISRDHEQFLGKGIEEIAYQKAGIIKQDRPVIVGDVPSEAWEIIQKIASEKNAPFYKLNHHFFYTIRKQKQTQKFEWKNHEHQTLVEISMYGEHQIKNCSIAFMALDLIEHYFPINWQCALKGIQKTQLPGRFERITVGNNEYILDGSHNVAGIKAFIDTVHHHFPKYKDSFLIFASFQDKAYEEMLSLLDKEFPNIMLTSFQHPRSRIEKDWRKWIKQNQKTYQVLDYQKILHKSLNENQDQLYFFTGSLHFIAEVRKNLLQLKHALEK